jgi:hypothetical protein
MNTRLLKKLLNYVRITKHGDIYMLEKRYSIYSKWCITMKTDSFFAIIRYKHNAWSALFYALGYGNKILKRYNR